MVRSYTNFRLNHMDAGNLTGHALRVFVSVFEDSFHETEILLINRNIEIVLKNISS